MMRSFEVVALALTALAVGAVPARQQEDLGPHVTVYRTWMAPQYTVAEGMVRVNPAQLEGGPCEYVVGITVRDKDGRAIMEDKWENTCPVVEGRNAPALEKFQFAMPPGVQYTVEASVAPKSRPAEKLVETLDVASYTVEPLASDLILAHEVGYVDSANAASWTIKRGSVGVRAASEMILEPTDADVSFYLELYPRKGRPMAGKATGVVLRQDGKQLASFPLSQLNAQEPQPIAANHLSVAGLPPGTYRFEVRLELGDTTVVREHPFKVLAPVVASAGGAGWFDTLSDEQLKSMFDGVVVWLTKAESDRFATLGPKGKRVFLAQQFGKEGPTPDDGQESAIDAYLARIKVVATRYAERAGRSGAAQEGWRTDRGRIYMMRGEPSTLLSRPSPRRGDPYELWQYSTRNGYVYLFADDTRMGHYRLIFTTDPTEQGIADWTKRVGPETLEDMSRLGIQVSEDIPPGQ